MYNLKGKVAIVSASTGGIGKSIALNLASNGAKVFICARNEEKARTIIEENKGLELDFMHFDATDLNSFDYVKRVFQKTNKIDILVNNFGTTSLDIDKTIADTEVEDFLKFISENLRSVFIPTKDFINLAKNSGGSIINISSIGGEVADISRICYTTSKGAIITMTKNIAIQAAKYNIRCNTILPGLINTPGAINNLPKEFLDVFIKNTPLHRIGEPSDIADLVLFLASEQSSFITAQAIKVTGGFGDATPLYGFFE